MEKCTPPRLRADHLQVHDHTRAVSGEPLRSVPPCATHETGGFAGNHFDDPVNVPGTRIV